MKTGVSIIVYFTFLFIVNVKVLEANSWRCDYTYVRKANGYFKYHKIPATWRDARLRCQDEGAILASPYPQVIYDSLLDLMKDQNSSSPVFTGVHATISKGDFYTIDGIPLSKLPIKWMVNEPNNYQNQEECLILNVDGFAADKNCDDPHPYFCYKVKKDDDNMFLGSCGTTDRAYKYSEVTRSCYKFHTTPRTWYRANMACSSEGGHLVVINSNEEAEYLKKLYAEHPSNTISLVGIWRDVAYVGFFDWKEHGDWRTIHGQTLHEAGYDKFSPGQPDFFTTKEYCGSVFRNILLNDAPCDLTLTFICEKKPTTLICGEDEEY